MLAPNPGTPEANVHGSVSAKSQHLNLEAQISLLQLSPKYLIFGGCDTANKIRYCFMVQLKSHSLVFSLDCVGPDKPRDEPFRVFLEDLVSSLNHLETFSNVFLSLRDRSQILVEQTLDNEKIRIAIPTVQSPVRSLYRQIKPFNDGPHNQWSWKKMASIGLLSVLDLGNLKYVQSLAIESGLRARETAIEGGRALRL